MVGHHNAMKEIQLVEAYVEDPDFDTTRITRMSPNDGSQYFLSIQSPTDNEYWTSEKINADASASSLRNAIKGYYW
jgi:hypothetical protein